VNAVEPMAAPHPAGQMGEAELEWVGIGKSFRSRGRTIDALDSVSFQVARHERVALTGPSGCGKTTLLNMAAGLVAPSRGTVHHAGRVVMGANTEVGYVTQRDTVLPWRTVEKNVALPLEIRGVDRAQRRLRVGEMLELVGLGGFDHLYPAELSGGMLKRLLLARTLVYRPRVLLLDEPFGALDAQLRLTLHGELIRIWEATGATIVLVTHDLAEAVSLADRVLVFGGRPSQVVAERRIDLPPGRDPLTTQFEPEFTKLTRELWQTLRDATPGGDEPDGDIPARKDETA
jgi:sulfonate transport system ATP-binding protein